MERNVLKVFIQYFSEIISPFYQKLVSNTVVVVLFEPLYEFLLRVIFNRNINLTNQINTE